MAVLALDEVKDALNIKQTVTDAQVGDLIGQAESFVANLCGPLEPTPVTSRIPGGRYLVLPLGPVLSITSVTGRSGATVTLPGNALAGAVLDPGQTLSEDWYDVAYVVGRETCPDDLRRAALEMCRHLWRPQRGAEQRSDAMSALRLAEDLMKPHRQYLVAV